MDGILEELFARNPALRGAEKDIIRAAEAIIGCYEAGGKLLLCGNGGSNADAEHIAGELMKGFLKKRPVSGEARRALLSMGEDGALLADKLQEALPAIPLNVTALSSAVVNDLGGELGYAQQVMALGKKGDLLLGISTSGNARNIHYAFLTARALGLTTLGLTGGTGGRMLKDADILICAPEKETWKVQEYHLPIYHALCRIVEERFFRQ